MCLSGKGNREPMDVLSETSTERGVPPSGQPGVFYFLWNHVET